MDVGATVSRWWAPLLALAALRAVPPLVVLAASGRDLPGAPPYTYTPLNGDSYGYYATAREFMATLGRIDPVVAAALALAALLVGWIGVRLWLAGRRWQGVVVVAAVLALALTYVVDRMTPSGAVVFGWPLLWSLPMLPYRTAGLPLDPDVAFGFGLALALAANAAAVVATAFVGLYTTGRRAVGLVAAALFAIWPLLTRPLAGPSAWENGQWQADVGLHLYTEPLSTALVAAAFALVLSPRLDDLRLALAGLALGYATLTKLSNGSLAFGTAVLVLLWLGPRRALPLAAAGLVAVPLVAVYWPQGYPALEHVPAWSPDYLAQSWTDSLIFRPGVLVVLLVPALLGALLVRRAEALALLAGAIVVTAVLYSFYEATWVHPRFLYVALPSLFVLQAAAVVALADRLRLQQALLATGAAPLARSDSGSRIARRTVRRIFAPFGTGWLSFARRPKK
jgi:hypothetical protein